MAELRDIKYLGKDFNQFRTNLIEFAKNYFPNTYNDFNESSPGMMFLEMSAYVGDVLSFYVDNQLKESLLSTAQESKNLYALAQSLGYKVKNKIASSVDLDVFQLLPSTPSGSTYIPDWNYALSIPAGMVVQSVSTGTQFRTLDSVDFKKLQANPGTNVTVYQLNETGNYPEYYLLKSTVKATAGTIKTVNYTFGNAVKFDKINVSDTDIIEIVDVTDSDNNPWTEVPNLAQDTVFETVSNTTYTDPYLTQYNDSVPYLLKLKKTARRFTSRFRTDGSIDLNFGAGISNSMDEEIIPNPDNVGSGLLNLQQQYDQALDPSNFMYTRSYGLAPSNTTLTVRYTTGGGIASNVPAFDLTNIVTLGFTNNTTGLDSNLLNQIQASVACTNPNPAVGGKDQETLDDIRYNAMSYFAAQNRAVTDQDYIIRTYSLPPKFGSVSKAYIIQDVQVDPQTNLNIPNPLALDLYCLGYDNNVNLTQLNDAGRLNLKNYLSQYRLLTDSVNIRDAFIINFGINFEIITLPEYNSNEVLLNCINALKTYFDINKWQINQPIILSKLYTLLDSVVGVQTVVKVDLFNLYNSDLGYSGNVYPMSSQEGGSTKNGVVYPSRDPSIFEIKFTDNDIKGRVVSL